MRFQGLTKGKIMKGLVCHTKWPGQSVDNESLKTYGSDHHTGRWERLFSLKWDQRMVEAKTEKGQVVGPHCRGSKGKVRSLSKSGRTTGMEKHG